jgi:hypothetical protein
VVLGGLAHNSANTGSGCAANQAPFESSAEYRAENRTAHASDGSAFAGADAAMALVETLVVAVVSMARLVILSAVAALPDTLVKVAAVVMTTVIALLRDARQRSE